MKINVTVSSVIIDNDYIVNRGEYKVNPCEFTFSEEYTNDLVKKAVFVIGNTEIERAIINNKCDIPYDVLDSEVFKLCVYAYEIVENELVLRYSPTYAKVFLREGSYRGVTGSGEIITPTQFEQYEQALNEGLNEMNEKLGEVDTALDQVENVDINAEKEGNIATVTITNRQGNQKTVEIHDGLDYEITEEDYQEIANVVETDITPMIPTKMSDLNNDSGFIDKDVNNLTNYYKTSETYSKAEVDSIVSSVYKYKGSVATYSDLPDTNLTIGDVYNVQSDGSNYAWTGTTWDKLGGDIDLSGYQTKIDSTHKLDADLVDDTNSTNKFTNATEKAEWNAKYNKPNTGIPSTDLASAVQTSLGKADTALQNTDYANDTTGGVIKVNNYYSTEMSNTGYIRGMVMTYSGYQSKSEQAIISKGTLENVLTAVVGDIDTLLDTINGEVI